ncbi:Poly(A)+ RNA export protein [Nemania sp. NC0429]|nr:Poly(A)+ RNA export protein [Nemania sp. NC0429]
MGSLDSDVTLPSDGEDIDTIGSLSWSPVSDHLAAASWDGKVRIYDVSSTGHARHVSTMIGDQPVLSCDWAKDGTMVVAGGGDEKIRAMDLRTSQQAVIGAHDAPVRGVRFVEVPGTHGPVVVSGSWDRTVRFWDTRQRPGARAAATLGCDERVYALDARAQLLVVATAGLRVHLVDLGNPAAFLDTVDSPLTHQTKAVAAFPDGRGWGIASIGGRCGIQTMDEDESSDTSFTFKCHRHTVENTTDNPAAGLSVNQGKASNGSGSGSGSSVTKVTNIYAVNDIQFHPVHSTTFATAGSDGSFVFWDRIARSRIRQYPPTPPVSSSSSSFSPSGKQGDGGSSSAITATSFSRDGRFFAYAVGYDWSRGCAGNTPETESKVVLHPVLEEDVKKPKPKPASRLRTGGRR